MFVGFYTLHLKKLIFSVIFFYCKIVRQYILSFDNTFPSPFATSPPQARFQFSKHERRTRL